MRRKKLLFIAMVAGAVFACGGGSDPETNEPAETAEPAPPPSDQTDFERLVDDVDVGEEAAPAVAVPAATVAVIVFYSNDVTVVRPDGSVPAELAMELDPGDRVVVGPDSFAEVHIGRQVRLMVESESSISLRDYVVTEQSAAARVGIDSGTLLSRLNRLVGNERLQVETEAAVAGVRGTEFSATVAPDGSLTVAVAEGEVFVRPSVSAVDSVVPRSERERDTIARLQTALEGSAATVAAGQRIAVPEPEPSLAAELEDVVPALDVEALAADDEALENVETSVRSVAASVRLDRTAEPADSQELERIARVRNPTVVPLPSAATGSEATQLVSLTVRTDPPGATVSFDGKPAAAAPVSSLFARDAEVAVEVSAEGYESRTLSIVLAAATGRVLSVPLNRLPEATSEEEPAPQPEPDPQPERDPQPEPPSDPVGAEAEPERSVDVDESESAPEEDVAETEPEPVVVPILVNAAPSSATIRVDGRVVGRGRAEIEAQEGSQVLLTISAAGYLTREIEITARPDGDRELDIELERELARTVVAATPAEAEVRLDGRLIGRGTLEVELPVGERVTFTVSADGYESESVSLIPRTGTGNRVSVTLERSVVVREIPLRVVPADARVSIDGVGVFSGSSTVPLEAGREYRLSAERDGYQPATRLVTISEDAPPAIELELDIRRVLWSSRVGAGRLVRELTDVGGAIAWASATGELGVVSTEGSPRWQIETANAPNENSKPVGADDRIYLTGSNELVVVNRDSGRVLERVQLDGDEAHIFGRSVVPVPGGYAYPNNTGVVVRRGEAELVVTVPGGSTMSPLLLDGVLYIASNEGTMHAFELDTGAEQFVVETNAVQPVAHAPVAWNDSIYFVGRRGRLVAVSTEGSVRWSATLPSGTFSDPVVGSAGIYVFAGGGIHGYTHDGERLFAPIDGAASAPVVSDSRILYGTTTGSVVAADARSGRATATVDIGQAVTTRPVVVRNAILVGTADGAVVAVNRLALEGR